MMRPTVPERMARHSVENSLFVSSSMIQKKVVYAVSPCCVGIVDYDSNTDSIFSPALFFLEDCIHEEISFIRVHPRESILCVGTVEHGVYITNLEIPVFDHTSRVPLSVSGELSHCGCFVTVGTFNILAFASSFKNRKGQSPHRLTLWDLDRNVLLWRGGTDLLKSMCVFDNEASFAACTDDKIYLFSVQQSSQAEDRDTGKNNNSLSANSADGKPKVIVFNRLCSTVEELEGTKYKECICSDDALLSTFVVLTTGGYLIAFDKETGSVIRWMDCKVSPVASATFTSEFVILAGSLIRFFTSESWEFKGKIKLDTNKSSAYLNNTLGLIYTAVVPLEENRCIFFSSNGSMSLQKFSSDTASVKNAKMQFEKRFLRSQIVVEEGDLVNWAFPQSKDVTDETWAVCSSSGLTVLDSYFDQKKLVQGQEIVCSTFLSNLNFLICVFAESNELVAYNARRGWLEWARAMSTTPVVSITYNVSSRIFCLRSDGQSICCYDVQQEGGFDNNGGGNPLSMFPTEEIRHFGEPLKRILCTEDGSLYGFSETKVFHLYRGGNGNNNEREENDVNDGESVLSLKTKIKAVSKLGADLIICHETGCVRYKTVTRESIVISAARGLNAVSVHANKPVVAISTSKEIAIYECFSEAKPRLIETIYHNIASGTKAAKDSDIFSISWKGESQTLMVLDRSGGFSEYYIETVRSSMTQQGKPPMRAEPSRVAPPPPPRAPVPPVDLNKQRLERRQRRSLSAGIPSSRELEDRFSDLSGFYENHKKLEETRSPRMGFRRMKSLERSRRENRVDENSEVNEVRNSPGHLGGDAETAIMMEKHVDASNGINIYRATDIRGLSPSGVEVSAMTATNDMDDNEAMNAGIGNGVDGGQALSSRTDAKEANESTHSEQARLLRQSLQQVRGLLQNESVEELSEEMSIHEIGEMASFMTSIALLLQSRYRSALTESTGGIASDSVELSSAYTAGEEHFLQQIEEQNRRLEEQNHAILSRLNMS